MYQATREHTNRHFHPRVTLLSLGTIEQCLAPALVSHYTFAYEYAFLIYVHFCLKMSANIEMSYENVQTFYDSLVGRYIMARWHIFSCNCQILVSIIIVKYPCYYMLSGKPHLTADNKRERRCYLNYHIELAVKLHRCIKKKSGQVSNALLYSRSLLFSHFFENCWKIFTFNLCNTARMFTLPLKTTPEWDSFFIFRSRITKGLFQSIQIKLRTNLALKKNSPTIFNVLDKIKSMVEKNRFLYVLKMIDLRYLHPVK
ncbi:hypothetical protein AGLY_000034 [Aphis glycines]|uniref:Uncharacterized protein n=1 Tax=Aphis glycines TaxID=307491 RepID=A0A6G0U6C6_APHGL|nr:hypothetical protein AGLY_000034 [Aphis glycines]